MSGKTDVPTLSGHDGKTATRKRETNWGTGGGCSSKAEKKSCVVSLTCQNLRKNSHKYEV